MSIASCLFFVLQGCNRAQNSYFSYEHIPSAGWKRNYEAVFRPEITDNMPLYGVSIELRHNNDYPYRNICFFVSLEKGGRTVRNDTVEYQLADNFGKWLGSGNTLFQKTLPYIEKYHFPDTGQYTIRIKQGMRLNVLPGVEDVGLRIEKR
jgi:gliding motility-associated lipoprotein GldH